MRRGQPGGRGAPRATGCRPANARQPRHAQRPIRARGERGLGQLSFNGVPLFGSVTGAFNLSTFPAEALERVEVVRGASAPRYGNRALGGVTRLSSLVAHEGRACLHLERGSYGTLSETVGGALKGAKARTTVTASRDDVFEDSS